MNFQQVIRSDLGHGIPGELAFDTPLRGKPGTLASTDAALNIVGYTAVFYTADGLKVAADSTAGVGAFAGIIANPKAYAWRGSIIANVQADALVLPNGTIAELVDEGVLFLGTTGTGQPGDHVYAVAATGALVIVAAGTAPTAAQRDIGAYVDRYPVTVTPGIAVVHVGHQKLPVPAAP